MSNNTMETKGKIAIIGGGIAGLCTAYWLKKTGYQVEVFEKSDQPGGAIRTVKENGFLAELGPNSALETSEILKNLVSELGLDEQKIYGSEESNKRYIVKNGTLKPIPSSLLEFLKTDLFSFKAKARLLKEPFISPSKDKDISLADLVKYRLGQEFLDYAINPFVAGVYAGDPKTLSAAAGFPKLYNLEQNYGSFIKGAFLGARERKKRKEVAKDRAKMFSFTDGMQVFPNALASHLGDNLKLNTVIQKIIHINKKYEITYSEKRESRTEPYDNIVICTPAFVTSALIADLEPDYATLLDDVYHPPVSVVYTGFKKENIKQTLDGFGFLIPELEKREILGSLWNSSIFPGRVPEGHVAFTTFVGGTRQPENAKLDDKSLTNVVLEELNDLVGISGEPVFIKIKKWTKAIPQYRIGYQKVQAVFDKMENKYKGLYFAGNFRRGISVGDSVLSAHETFQKMIKDQKRQEVVLPQEVI